jgi:aminopeptidase
VGTYSPPLEAYADLIVGFAANVQPGQVVSIQTEPGKETLTRLVAAEAYKRGARFVDVWSFDPFVKRARIEHASGDTLDYVPPWWGRRLRELSDLGAARISLSGPAEPGALDDLEPARAGRDRMPTLAELGDVVNARTTNWTAAPCPTAGWARLIHPELEPDEALATLWRQIVYVCRLDEPDPPAAWHERMTGLEDVCRRLGERRFGGLHLEGPGTDLRIGLLPTSSWQVAEFTRADGLRHLVNLPSEEVFTTPDPERVDGHVRSTRPLELAGTIIHGLEVTFAGGRATSVEADSGVEALRTALASDDDAARLGEVALVDGDGRVGATDTVFYDTLLDENAASHLALGHAYEFAVGEQDLDRINRSKIHIDFMVGSPEVAVTGITDSGERVPVLIRGEWQI